MTSGMGVEERTRWFREARFGMFIHWNLFNLTGQGGWEVRRGWVNMEEWRAAAARWKPRRFQPEAWASLAREAGMRYAVLTTMSADGFAIFDSPDSSFTTAKGAAGRDFVRGYVEAFRRAGLRVGLYYSLTDWMWPAHRAGPQDSSGWERYVEHVHSNVRALCSNYGPIDILWFDTPGSRSAEDYRSRELLETVRRLQPAILVNDRAALPKEEADIVTPEQEVGKFLGGRVWETCMTMNEHWPYTRGDHNWRTDMQLHKILAGCAAGGGNLLLDVGPTPDGVIPPPAVARLRRLGKWLERYGEAIYGTGYCGTCRCPYTMKTMRETPEGSFIYLLVDNWPHDDTYHLMDFPHRDGFGPYQEGGWDPLVLPEETAPDPKAVERIREVRVFPDGQRLTAEPRATGILLRGLPRKPPDPYLSVIRIELAG